MSVYVSTVQLQWAELSFFNGEGEEEREDEVVEKAVESHAPQELASQDSPPFYHPRRGLLLACLLDFTIVFTL